MRNTGTLVSVVRVCAIAGFVTCVNVSLARAQEPLKISVDWSKTLSVSKTIPSMQVTPMRRGCPLHEVTFSAIRQLDAKYVRYLLWGPYPRLQIAALEPPAPQGTSWDFSYIDPALIDFLEATKGREPVINFGTFNALPPWMLKRSTPASYPDDVDQMDWRCSGDRPDRSEWEPQLLDPTGQQLADYYARIVSWYTQGSFTDENGKYHHSGHRYELPWWGVLNEADFLGPERYTVVYDAIVSAIRKVSPKTRFVALELAGTAFPTMSDPEFFEHFLNPKNHQPGIPLNMIAYHFYAFPSKSQTVKHWQYTFFDQADAFLAQVRFIESIRKRLSPSTLVYLPELGSILPEDTNPCSTPGGSNPSAIPLAYWNLSAALYAYLYIELAKLGIDVVGQSGFRQYPGNFASVSMVNWETGKLNARFHVLKLLKEHFGPGDRLAFTTLGEFPAQEDVAAQAFDTSRGRKVLLINKRSRPVEVELYGIARTVHMEVVDERSGESPARNEGVTGKRVRLEPFAVAVLAVK